MSGPVSRYNWEKLYLRVSFLTCLVLMVLAPPSPERQLLKHLRRVAGTIETELAAGREPDIVAATVCDYVERHQTRISLLRSYLDAYGTRRSLLAFERLEPGIRELGRVAREHPEMDAQTLGLLFELLP